MRKWIVVSLLSFCGILVYAQTVQDDYKALSQSDQELLSRLFEMVDNGMSEVVAPDFDQLLKRYPKNYLVQYERLYNLYLLGRYDEVMKARKSMLGNKRSTERAYQIIGNSFDLTGDRKTAFKVYMDGIKQFPESGFLLMEVGTLYLLDGDYDKALEYYNKGIVAQPNFASNYFRAANLYLSSTNFKVWGLIYAESAILLAPSDESRHKQLADGIVNCLKESISMTFGDKAVLSVNLVPGRGMSVDEKSKVVYLSFPGVYEGAIVQPLNKMFMEKNQFTGSISQLIEVRKGLVEAYFTITDNLYGSSMYLLEFQKKIIDAGHWDAYNYFLFMQCYPEEFKEWYSANSEIFDEFLQWYNNDPYKLGEGRSVNQLQIFDSYRQLDMFESLRVQAKLLMDSDQSTESDD